MLSSKGFILKEVASVPHSADADHGCLWLNSADHQVYLDGTPLSGVTGPAPPDLSNLQAYTVTDQSATYISTKQLAFHTDSLKKVDAGSVSTIELADTITKSFTFANNLITHETNELLNITDLYDHAFVQFNGNTSMNVDSYTLNIGAQGPSANGVIFSVGYSLASDGDFSRPVFQAYATPSEKYVIFGDNANSDDYIKVEPFGNVTLYNNNVAKLQIDNSANTITHDGTIYFGSPTSGTYISIGTDGQMRGVESGVQRWNINIDGSHSFGSGKNNTIVFNSSTDNADIWTVTNNTYNKTAKYLMSGVDWMKQTVGAFQVLSPTDADFIIGGVNENSLRDVVINWVASAFGL